MRGRIHWQNATGRLLMKPSDCFLKVRQSAMPVASARRSTVEGTVASCSSTRSGAHALITVAIASVRPIPPLRML